MEGQQQDSGVNMLVILALVILLIVGLVASTNYTKRMIKCRAKSRQTERGDTYIEYKLDENRKSFLSSSNYKVYIKVSTSSGVKRVEITGISMEKGDDEFLDEMLLSYKGEIMLPIAEMNVNIEDWKVKLKKIEFLPPQDRKFNDIKPLELGFVADTGYREGVYTAKPNQT